MTERRSTRANKGAKYKEFVADGMLNFFWEKEKPLAVRRLETTYPRKTRTLKYFLEQAAVLPEIGDPDTDIDCRLYTTDEIEASLALVEMSREAEEKRKPSQEEIDAAVELTSLSKNWEERRATEQVEIPKVKTSRKRANKTSKPPPNKRAKKNSDEVVTTSNDPLPSVSPTK
ncbi:uncharacterized protein LOC143769819 isoform X2 [Ranitomeya variabilis]|uniref:uncharacterized protein LOC143769819 isoform X2 n=1 Tax=Ranitomeya variabilis TaxID=490064 RepID=UPI004057BEB5